MATGFLAQGVCYASSSDAADALFSSGSPSVVPGATTYTAWFEKAGGVWQLHRQSIAGGVVTDLGATAQVAPTFPGCDPTENFFDGLAVGWAVVALMAAAWGWLQIRRAAR